MKSFLLFLCLLLTNILFAQSDILIRNGSFEADKPRQSTVPSQWYNCGGVKYSPPDLHAKRTKYFKAKNSPQDGKIFLAMVVRDDYTTEAIGQELIEPMTANTTYQLTLYLAQSQKYASYATSSQTLASFTEPARIRLWASNSRCERQQLLGQSPIISSPVWQEHHFEFETTSAYRFLIIEAYYDKKDDGYNGNILIDNVSNLRVKK